MDLSSEKGQWNFMAKMMTVFGFITAVFGIPFGFIPGVGVFVLPFCIGGLLFCGIAYRLRKKMNLGVKIMILPLLLNLFGIGLGFKNYIQHKSAVDFLLAPGSIPTKIIKMGVEEEKEKAKTALINQAKEKANEVINGDSAQDSEAPQQSESESDNLTIQSVDYMPIVDNLNIRKEPSLDSEKIYQVNFGQPLIYMGEKSGDKLQLTIGGKERDDYWYKVRGQRHSTEGWVYGGAIASVENESFIDHKTNRLIKNYIRISGDSLKALTGVKSQGSTKAFHGVVSYDKESGVKDGKFYFRAITPKREHEYSESVAIYTGQYKNGLADGKFVNYSHYYETGSELFLEYQKGKCISSHYRSSSEGEIENSYEKKREELIQYDINPN